MISINMRLKGETKNKFRFTEDSDNPMEHVGDLYVQKKNWPDGPPSLINVVVRGIAK